jgi:hypothetical protein
LDVEDDDLVDDLQGFGLSIFRHERFAQRIQERDPIIGATCEVELLGQQLLKSRADLLGCSAFSRIRSSMKITASHAGAWIPGRSGNSQFPSAAFPAQPHIQFDQLLADNLIVGTKGADLSRNAHRLTPVKALQIDIGHTMQDGGVPIPTGVSLLDGMQRGGIGLARHIQLSETVVDIRQVKIFLDGFIDLTAGCELIDQECAGSDIHRCEVDDPPEQPRGLTDFTAHAVRMRYNTELGDGILGAPLLDEQVSHQGVQRQISGSAAEGIERLVHGNAHQALAGVFVDAIH